MALKLLALAFAVAFVGAVELTLDQEYAQAVGNGTNVTEKMAAAVKTYDKAVQRAKEAGKPLESAVQDLKDLASNRSRIDVLARDILRAAGHTNANREDERNAKFAESAQKDQLKALSKKAREAINEMKKWARQVDDDIRRTHQPADAADAAYRQNERDSKGLEHDFKELAKQGEKSIKHIYKAVEKNFKHSLKSERYHDEQKFYGKVQALQEEEEKRQEQEDAAIKAAEEKAAAEKAAAEKAAAEKAEAEKKKEEDEAAAKKAAVAKVAAANATAAKAVAEKNAAEKAEGAADKKAAANEAAEEVAAQKAASEKAKAEKAVATEKAADAKPAPAEQSTPSKAPTLLSDSPQSDSNGVAIFAACIALISSVCAGMIAFLRSPRQDVETYHLLA